MTTTVTKILENKEKKSDAEIIESGVAASEIKTHFSSKLKKLNYVLWGGSGLLAFEHLWHGEIQPFFPYLTAVSDPAAKAEMLHEMSTVGVSMALLVTLVWGVTTAIISKVEKNENAMAAEPEKRA